MEYLMRQDETDPGDTIAVDSDWEPQKVARQILQYGTLSSGHLEIVNSDAQRKRKATRAEVRVEIRTS